MHHTWTGTGLTLALVGPGLVALFATTIATDPETLGPRAFSLALFLGFLLTVLSIAFKGEKLRWADIGFANVSWLSVVWAVPVTLFFVFVFGPAAYTVLSALDIGSFDTGRNRLMQLPALYLVPAIVVVAGGEEWLYRGYAIERIEAITGKAWIAGLISLTLFVLAHLPLWGPGPALTTLVSGGILTILYIWKRDIVMLIVAHVATDLYGLMVPLLVVS